jgi:tetratricopeptide (TPR) repeat protein
LDEAIAEFRQSLRLNNESAPTHYNLGYALSARGRRDEAIAALEAALRIDPDYGLAHNNLGALLQLAGKPDQALEHYQRAVALRPDNVEARANLGQLLSIQGRVPEAVDQFREALALKADHPQALAGLAWVRATAFDPAFRNAEEGVRLAEQADRATAHRALSVLDVLAAAYASAGRYEDAVAVVRTALEVAVAAGQSPVVAQFRQRLELYTQHKPYRLPPP